MSKYKVDNVKLWKELKKYTDTCEFKWVRNKKGVLKKKIKSRGKVSSELGEMIKKIAEGLSTKGNWRGYTWKEDFVSQAVLTVLEYMHNFNPDEYTNAHGYINRICYNAFVRYTGRENSHSSIKQELWDKKNYIDTEDASVLNYEEYADNGTGIKGIKTEESEKFYEYPENK